MYNLKTTTYTYNKLKGIHVFAKPTLHFETTKKQSKFTIMFYFEPVKKKRKNDLKQILTNLYASINLFLF